MIYSEPTTIKLQADENSHFSFQLDDPLSMIWQKRYRCFVLKCPISFKMDNSYNALCSTKNPPRLEQGRTQEFSRGGAEILRKMFCSH